MNIPIIYEWDGDAMIPLPRFKKIADETFVVHELYRMEVREERSLASHSHFFAALTEAWQNLPEIEADRFPTVEHLRKWCLIKAGFADQRQHVASSKAEAVRLAAFIRPLDEYAIIVPSESVVTVYTAKSQSMKAMGKKDFQASKDAVLSIAWGLVGMKAEDAARHVGRAA